MAVAFGAALAGPSMVSLLLLGLAVWALFGARNAFEALTLSWLVAHLNPVLFGAVDSNQALRWFILTAVFLRMTTSIILDGALIRQGTLPLATYAIIVMSLGIVHSYNVALCLLKITVFFVGAWAVLTTCHFLSDSARMRIEIIAFCDVFFGSVLVVSVLFINSDLGYIPSSELFRGVFWHSQVLGTFAAVLLVWYFDRFLSARKGKPVYAALAFLAVVAMAASGARTAFVGIGIGMGLTLAVGAVLRRDWLSGLACAMNNGVVVLGLASALAFAVVFSGPLTRVAIEFALKGGTAGSVEQALDESRGRVVAASWANFLEHPLAGIGFGLASDPDQLVIQTEPLFGLPIGAPVEKGILPVAILEETGVIGGLAFLWLIAALAWPVVRYGTAAQFCLFATCLGINVGEALFLSFGGHGLFVWLMIGLTRTLSFARAPSARNRVGHVDNGPVVAPSTPSAPSGRD